MAKARSVKGGDVNRSEKIREVATSLGKGARPRDIRAALHEQGINVSAALITNVLSRSKKTLRRQRTESASAKTARSTPGGLSIEALVEAKKFVAKVGSIKQARLAIEALARLM